MTEVNNTNTIVEKLERHLAAKGMRRTPERFKILEQVLCMPKEFVIEDLNKAMANNSFMVSQSTLYNTVDLFVDAGILRRIIIDDGPSHYVKEDGVNYIHLVCDECGKIKLLKDLNFMAYMNARKFPAFTTRDYNFTVYGTCNDCARRIKREQREAKAAKKKNH